MTRGNEGIFGQRVGEMKEFFGQWVEEIKDFLAELGITLIAESESENREIFQFHEISLFDHFEMKMPRSGLSWRTSQAGRWGRHGVGYHTPLAGTSLQEHEEW